jgi:hypothetical protein
MLLHSSVKVETELQLGTAQQSNTLVNHSGIRFDLVWISDKLLYQIKSVKLSDSARWGKKLRMLYDDHPAIYFGEKLSQKPPGTPKKIEEGRGSLSYYTQSFSLSFHSCFCISERFLTIWQSEQERADSLRELIFINWKFSVLSWIGFGNA